MNTAWYEAKMGNDHQGLVIEEATGRNVAVAYDKVDARLIAAAPDLLAALAFVRDALDRHISNHGDYEALCEDLQDMDEAVRAAIAKALGES